MNVRKYTVTQCITLSVLLFSVHATHADALKKIKKHEKSRGSLIASLEIRCAEKSARDPYATYQADTHKMRCIKKSISAKPVCSDGYYLLKKRCIKGMKP